ncbi:MAG: hypothetical protein AMXMBFR66_18520 [Pseudomonadota bacterium]|jgi:uncharacterized SAM-binding protein YcdF (DUF218 family)|nr:YdcF family protein [Rubrivivax sp.]NLZ43182.1 YdcF family protein [Comamonadaceae bacterium]
MNELLLWLGVDAWRPVASALLLPPVPFLLLVLVGARLLLRHLLLGWALIVMACLGLWFGSTDAGADVLRRVLLPPARALAPPEIAALRKAPNTAIVVLGGGRKLLAPEYGVSDLTPLSLERLRYGLWLGRQTGLPVMYSGGIGHGRPAGPAEAEIAARVAERDFRQPLRWQEGKSRDTRENALESVALLRGQGIERIVVVTHAYHMPRALRNFERALHAGGAAAGRIVLVAAPMRVAPPARYEPIDFLPSRSGCYDTQLVLHEWVGRLIGA